MARVELQYINLEAYYGVLDAPDVEFFDSSGKRIVIIPRSLKVFQYADRRDLSQLAVLVSGVVRRKDGSLGSHTRQVVRDNLPAWAAGIQLPDWAAGLEVESELGE